MIILSIDPGTYESGIVVYENLEYPIIHEAAKISNNEICLRIASADIWLVDIISIEMLQCMGMPAGKTLLETCVWIGMFMGHAKSDVVRFTRKQIVSYICGSSRAKDSNVRQAMIDMFEPGLGPRKRPKGMLKGIKSDMWQALALAVYTSDMIESGKIKEVEYGEQIKREQAGLKTKGKDK